MRESVERSNLVGAKKKAGHRPAFLLEKRLIYSVGAGAGAVSAGSSAAGGGVAAGSVGVVGVVWSAGGSTLWVVVPSVSLQAATPNRAIADTDARISFLIVFLLQNCFLG